MRTKFIHTYDHIISLENLLEAWGEFVVGKKFRKDVQEFSRNLMTNIISLHNDLKNKTYKHSSYEAFNISDPKPRNIHKANVRDRLLHHAIYRILYPYFDTKFIHDSYSCRDFKSTHKAINRFREFAYIVSKNNTKTFFVLKCDIRKFFASIDHEVLVEILKKHISDQDIIRLLEGITLSFCTAKEGVGLPLGNLTSQLFVNIYMNEFDHYMKRELKAKYYIRYADDFVILQNTRIELEDLLPKINLFLTKTLKLTLHPDKVFIKTFASGVDFLGWVHFTNHRVLRTATRKRMFNKLGENPSEESVASYLGLLSHGNAYKLKQNINDIIS